MANMTELLMPNNRFERIERLPPYVFAEVNAMKASARAMGEDVIDLGMGNPDMPPAEHIIEKLRETALNPRVHGYSTSRGIPGLRKAKAAYYQRRFGVELDPEKEIVVSIGSKEGLANLASAITSAGDSILVPNPSYPIHPYGFIIAGGSIRHVPKTLDVPFMDCLKAAIKHTSPLPKALVLNYPCNPTTEVVDLDFYEEIVDLCRHYGIYVLSDLAYCEIYFDDNPPPSILQVKGAKDIAVEFTSMSKTYSMAGWRTGFAVGNQTLIAALTKIKSYVDYGAFTPLQVAACAALNGPQDCVEQNRRIYKERRDILVDGLNRAGWPVESPSASMFIWAKLPESHAHLGSLEFSKQLLQGAKVAVAPGIGFGEYGDPYVRIAMVENKQRLRQACRNIKAFLKG
jgi:alanine-synthesizing transaminase